MRWTGLWLLVMVWGCRDCEDEPFDCTVRGTLCTVVGTGAFGFNGDGLPAEEAYLYFPTSVRFGVDGLPLVVDYNNLRVRRVTAQGALDTVAGSGFHAFGIEGPALESPLENPIDVAPDPEGGFFIAEEHAARILHVDADGQLTIVAGTGEIGYTGDEGPAADALLSEALGIALSDDGTLFIADTDNHVIRAIDPSSGVIRTVATGLARPQRMAWVGPTLLVADSDSHRVVEVDPLDGTVVPLVGTGAPGFSGDGGPASEATLDTPLGVGVAEDGTLYIADSENHVIRSVGPNGTIQTVAGVGTPVEGEDAGVAIEVGLRRPFDVTVGPEGRVWISDTLNSRVRVLTP